MADIEAAATPETGPVSEDAAVDNIVAMLDAEEAATAQVADSDNPEAGETAKAEPDDEGETQTVEADKSEGNEEPEESKDETPAIDPTVIVKVKVNGETLEVPLQEALDGYSRLEDYKAKTAQLAEHRKSVETSYAENLTQTVNLFEALDPYLAQAQNVDWNALAQSDPAQFVALQQQVKSRLETINQARAQIQQIEKRQASETQQREGELLLKAMPQLADPKEAQKFETELTGFLLKDVGFAPERLQGLTALEIQVANDAMQWRRMKAAQAKLPDKKIVTKPASKPLVPQASSDAPRGTPRRPGPNASNAEKHNWVLRQLDKD
jgi:hypothetical protein